MRDIPGPSACRGRCLRAGAPRLCQHLGLRQHVGTHRRSQTRRCRRVAPRDEARRGMEPCRPRADGREREPARVQVPRPNDPRARGRERGRPGGRPPVARRRRGDSATGNYPEPQRARERRPGYLLVPLSGGEMMMTISMITLMTMMTVGIRHATAFFLSFYPVLHPQIHTIPYTTATVQDHSLSHFITDSSARHKNSSVSASSSPSPRSPAAATDSDPSSSHPPA